MNKEQQASEVQKSEELEEPEKSEKPEKNEKSEKSRRTRDEQTGEPHVKKGLGIILIAFAILSIAYIMLNRTFLS